MGTLTRELRIHKDKHVLHWGTCMDNITTGALNIQKQPYITQGHDHGECYLSNCEYTKTNMNYIVVRSW